MPYADEEFVPHRRRSSLKKRIPRSKFVNSLDEITSSGLYAPCGSKSKKVCGKIVTPIELLEGNGEGSSSSMPPDVTRGVGTKRKKHKHKDNKEHKEHCRKHKKRSKLNYDYEIYIRISCTRYSL